MLAETSRKGGPLPVAVWLVAISYPWAYCTLGLQHTWWCFMPLNVLVALNEAGATIGQSCVLRTFNAWYRWTDDWQRIDTFVLRSRRQVFQTILLVNADQASCDDSSIDWLDNVESLGLGTQVWALPWGQGLVWRLVDSWNWQLVTSMVA